MHDFPVDFIWTWLLLLLLPFLALFQNNLKSKSTYGMAFILDQTYKQYKFQILGRSVISKFQSIGRISNANQNCVVYSLKKMFILMILFLLKDFLTNIKKTVIYIIRNVTRKKRRIERWEPILVYKFSNAIVITIMRLCKIYVWNAILLYSVEVAL